MLVGNRNNGVAKLRRSVSGLEVNLLISCSGRNNRLVVLDPEEGVNVTQSSENVGESKEPEQELLSSEGSTSGSGVEACLNDDHLEQARDC